MSAPVPPCQTGISNILSLLIWLSGIVSAVAAQLMLRFLFSRADGMHARIDELCVVADQLPNIAHNYWSLEDNDIGLNKAEAELFAQNHKLNALSSNVFFKKQSIKEVSSNALFDLSNSATGSDFQVTGRKSQPRRYMEVQARAMIFISGLRKHQDYVLTRLWG